MPARTPSFTEFVALIALMMGLTALSIDNLLPAFPPIQATFGIRAANELQLLVYVYMLGFGVAQFVYGPLSDAVGRRPTLLVGLAIYAVGCLLAALAPTFEVLLRGPPDPGDRRRGGPGPRGGDRPRLLFGAGDGAGHVADLRGVHHRPRLRARHGQRDPARGRMAHPVPQHAGLGARGRALVLAAHARNAAPRVPPPALGRPILAGGPPHGDEPHRHRIFDRHGAHVRLPDGLCRLSAADLRDGSLRPGALFPRGLRAHRRRHGRRRGRELGAGPAPGHAAPVARGILAFLGLAAAQVLAALAFDGRPPLLLFGTILAGGMFVTSLTVSNFNAMAMEPLGAVAGTASSFMGFYTTLIGAFMGALIGQSFDGTVLPLGIGYVVSSGLAVLTVLWTENGRLFRPQHRDPAP